MSVMSTQIYISIKNLLPQAAIVVVLLAAAGAAAGDSVSEWQYRWDVSANPTVTISSAGIDVLVEPGDAEEIVAVLEKEGAALGKRAATVSHRVDGNTVSLDVRARPFVGVRYLRLRVRVPSNVNLDLRSRSGDLAVRGLHGNLHLETSSGDVDADGVDGSVSVATRTGSARLLGRFDRLNVRTRSGAIEAGVLPGSRLASGWEIQSRSGSVSLRVPPSLAAEVQARTFRGRIHSDLPLIARGLQNKELLRGDLNGGGPTLLVWSDRGTIRLSAG